MKIGDKGIDVLEAQQWLVSIGYLDSIESFYSINTKNAVYTLEEDIGVTPTGEFYEELKYLYDLYLQEATPMPAETDSDASGGNSREQAGFEDYLKDQQKYPCYIVNLLTNRQEDNNGVIFIPHIPEEFSYTKGNVYEEQLTKGRSEPFQGYTGSTALTTNVSFVVTADYSPNHDIDLVLNRIEALCYPRYGSIVKPPKAFFRCGTFTTEGIVTEVTITRKLPIIDGKYSQAEVNISFTETHPESVTAADVGVAGWRD